MKEILRQHSFSIAFLVVLFGVVFYPDGGGEIEVFEGFTMGTTYRVQVADFADSLEIEQVSADIAALFEQMDREIFSTYAPDSELSQLNRFEVGRPFPASTHMMKVMSLAREVSVLTGGAFDVTVGPLVDLWGFGPTLRVYENVPDQAAINSALDRVGFRHVLLNHERNEIIRTRDVAIDLSAIAKGYAVDEIGEYLANQSMENYFIEVGGELKMSGFKAEDEGWVPAIEAPVDAAPSIYEVFYSRGDSLAVAGSGDYRNYFEVDGVRYSHEIDPRTGYPVTHNLAAAYVIDDSAARADALATAFMILGLESAQQLSDANRMATYFIYKQSGDSFAEQVSTPFNRYLAQE